MTLPAVHWRYAHFDGAAAATRILTSRYRARVQTALVLVLEGVGYRRAAYSVGLRDHRDVHRAAGKLGLRELHLERKRLRDAMTYSERDASAIDAVLRGGATPSRAIRSFRVSVGRLERLRAARS